jgi:hypothetical protein
MPTAPVDKGVRVLPAEGQSRISYAETAEWRRVVAWTSELVECCECRACHEAEALASAVRLRAIGG